MTIEFEWSGVDDMFKRMKALEDRVEKRIGKAAIRAGGNEYAKLLRQNIPVDDKDDNIHLKKSIAVRGVKGKFAKNMIRVQVGVIGPATRYAHIYEWGSRFFQGTRIFTKTLESNVQAILNRIALKLRMELDKFNG